MCRSAETSGATMRPRRGGQDEFYGVKEYRTGENPRWIYWRRSARTGVLVAKEMTQVSPPRLLLLVDTYIDPRRARSQRTRTSSARSRWRRRWRARRWRQGLSVGVLAWSGRHGRRSRPARGKRHRRDVLAVLARLPLNTTHEHAARCSTPAATPSRSGDDAGAASRRATCTSAWAITCAAGWSSSPPTREQARRWFRFPRPSTSTAACRRIRSLEWKAEERMKCRTDG